MAPSPDNKSSSSINIEHPTPEAYGGVPQMIERANSACKEHERVVDPPNKWEVGAWYVYSLCSYFVHAFLVPVIFPLMISMVAPQPVVTEQDRLRTRSGSQCNAKEIKL